MNPDVKKYFQDILDSISRIEHHLASISSPVEFINNITVSDAVERRLAIIGEALWKATKTDPAVLLTDQKKIIGLKHILVHEYDMIDDGTIWKICQSNLPILKNEVTLLIEK
jgi:uncharacterized protein with HEPN domain